MFRRSYFWFLLVLGIVLHALTLPYSPPHWQDEVQVNEIGRASLERSDWSMYWVRGFFGGRTESYHAAPAAAYCVQEADGRSLIRMKNSSNCWAISAQV